MSGLSLKVADYLAVRRSLGYKLARPEKLLAQFTAYLDQAGAATVTTEHALGWAILPGGDPAWRAYRLAVVRGFTAWLATTDPAAEIPPAGLIPSRKQRATPYLYDDREVAALIAAAESLRFPLRTATYQTLIGLLAVTGMRVGEVIGLDRGDADLDAGVLTVRNGKHGKSRLVPAHDTTAQALVGYLHLRDRLCPDAAPEAVLVSPAGTRLLYCNVHATRKKLAASAGLRPRSGSCRSLRQTQRDHLSDVGGVVAYHVADLLDGDAAADGATWVEDDLASFQAGRSSLAGPPPAVRDG
jgi:integrase